MLHTSAVLRAVLDFNSCCISMALEALMRPQYEAIG